jgi:hypothetical protein
MQTAVHLLLLRLATMIDTLSQHPADQTLTQRNSNVSGEKSTLLCLLLLFTNAAFPSSSFAGQSPQRNTGTLDGPESETPEYLRTSRNDPKFGDQELSSFYRRLETTTASTKAAISSVLDNNTHALLIAELSFGLNSNLSKTIPHGGSSHRLVMAVRMGLAVFQDPSNAGCVCGYGAMSSPDSIWLTH